MSGIGFDAVIGQKMAVAHLQNAIRKGHLSQAYLIHGEKGSGKTALATALSAVVMCEHPEEKNGRREPCGCCHSCRQIAAGSHPDVVWVTNERIGTAAKTSTIGVAAARFVQSDVAVKPYQGPYKIYIIPDADRMNPQAQNALLKTLEEPPSYAMLVLLSDNPAAFLPTVLSRCVAIRLQPAPEAELLQALEKEGVCGEPARTAARLSHGNPGRCRALIGEELQAFRQEAIEMLQNLKETDACRLLLFAQKLAGEKDDKASHMEDFLDFARSWYRDLLVMKSTGTEDGLIFREQIPYIRNAAAALSYQGLQRSMEAFDEAERRRRSKESEAQVAELLLLQLRRILRQGRD